MELEQNINQEVDKKQGNIGPIIGIIIIVVLMILGGIYYLGSRVKEQVLIEKEAGIIQDIEINNIEKELNSEELENIDTELEQLEKEFDNL
jgi:hypothetical protein